MKLTLKNVRLAFPSLFKPQAGQDGGDPKFNATFLFAPDSDNTKAIKDAMNAVAKEKWGEKAPAILAKLVEEKRVCFHTKPKTNANGDLYAGFEGMYFVSASNKARPTVRDRDGKTELTSQDGKPYGGSYVYAVLDIWAQDNTYGRRINASLMGVQFFKDGEAFSGGGAASDADFEELETVEEDFV